MRERERERILMASESKLTPHEKMFLTQVSVILLREASTKQRGVQILCL